MSTIKNGLISLYCNINSIIKGLELVSSSQHYTNNMLKMFVI